MSAIPAFPQQPGKSPIRVVFSGMIASDPCHGGATWAVLQYVLGLKRLGHEVIFVEPMKASAQRPPRVPLAASENVAYFREVTRQFGIERCSALLIEGARETVGMAYDDILRFAKRADLLINVSGMLTDPALLEAIPRRAYLDLDPAFIQVWHHTYGIDMRFAAHTHFVTIGQRLGLGDCPVPTCGREWLKTQQPVVLDEWPWTEPRESADLTTIGNWRGYGSVEFEGRHYGQKAHSLRQFIALPRFTKEKLAPALAIHPAEETDIAALSENGWTVQNPSRVAPSPSSYRRFIQQSKAEFGIAKSGYVASRCGWFSDRSGCYLASGRPVIAQQTGFEGFLPVGRGLFAFETMEHILAAIEELRRNYLKHARAAREIAEEHLESGKVLTRLLEQVGLGA
jgi:hypothetical protein